MTTDPTENAFPIFSADGRYNPLEGGLTKREYFAALAMQGLLNSNFTPDGTRWSPPALADWSVELADHLIAALNGEGQADA